MFTGLIETTGQVIGIDPVPSGRRLTISMSMAAECQPGDSIAINGVCLTVAVTAADRCEFDLSPETLRVTTLGDLLVEQRVNLERPLRSDARLGGHFVLGHVDGIARVTSISAQGDSRWLEIELPSELAPAVVEKGSIAVDGISLTVAGLAGTRVGLQIVPFTLKHTTLCDIRVGDAVNVETDILGKHVARLLDARREPAQQT